MSKNTNQVKRVVLVMSEGIGVKYLIFLLVYKRLMND